VETPTCCAAFYFFIEYKKWYIWRRCRPKYLFCDPPIMSAKVSSNAFAAKASKGTCVLQKKIIRIISACKYRDHTWNYFKELRILKFRDINILQTAILMYNVDRKLLPSHLTKSFYQNNEIHYYCTRSSNNYYLESVNTEIKQFSIKYKGPILWNSIDLSIRSLKNNQFKRHLLNTLLK